MRLDPLFGLTILGSFAAFGLLAGLYLWPWLRRLSREEALRLLVLPHMFRFAGLSFLVTGVVSPALPASFAVPAAYGDLGAAILAIATIFALCARAPSAFAIAWLFNAWSSLDLLFAFYNGIAINLEPGTLCAAHYIPTSLVPALLVTHGLIFIVLLAHVRAGDRKAI